VPHEVKLHVFEGPIELLLHLITRRRVDIYEVSLATITDEYLDALSRMEGPDLERTTGFLVVAATLLELKSLRLLPGEESGSADGRLLEERDALLARLVECATFKAAGSHLNARMQEGDLFRPRSVSLEDRFAGLVPDLLGHTTVADLAAAAGVLLAPKPPVELDTSHVAPIRATVRDAILDLAGPLADGRPYTFGELCAPGMPRIEVVVRFLALLEMFKAGAVELSQLGRFGDITARWTGTADLSEVLQDVEEYALDAGGKQR
jgi:segregation and condensation protein A